MADNTPHWLTTVNRNSREPSEGQIDFGDDGDADLNTGLAEEGLTNVEHHSPVDFGETVTVDDLDGLFDDDDTVQASTAAPGATVDHPLHVWFGSMYCSPAPAVSVPASAVTGVSSSAENVFKAAWPHIEQNVLDLDMGDGSYWARTTPKGTLITVDVEDEGERDEYLRKNRRGAAWTDERWNDIQHGDMHKTKLVCNDNKWSVVSIDDAGSPGKGKGKGKVSIGALNTSTSATFAQQQEDKQTRTSAGASTDEDWDGLASKYGSRAAGVIREIQRKNA